MKIYNVIQFVSQGGFPSPAKLLELKQQRTSYLLNISGINLFRIYDEEQLDSFNIMQFSFKDVFSIGNRVTEQRAVDKIDINIYTDKALEAEQKAFFKAVTALIECLKKDIHVYVFCQQGIGRSPCVVLTALDVYYQPSKTELEKTLNFINPNAVLTQTSYAAKNWFQRQCKNENLTVKKL